MSKLESAPSHGRMIFPGAIFYVRVLNDDNVAGCTVETCPKRSALALIFEMIKEDIDGFAEDAVSRHTILDK